MVKYNKINAKLSDSQLSQTVVTLRMSMKMFEGNNLPHKLLLTTRQKNKVKKFI